MSRFEYATVFVYRRVVHLLHLKYVYDGPLGISFYWVPNTYSNTFYVFVEVFPPS